MLGSSKAKNEDSLLESIKTEIYSLFSGAITESDKEVPAQINLLTSPLSQSMSQQSIIKLINALEKAIALKYTPQVKIDLLFYLALVHFHCTKNYLAVESNLKKSVILFSFYSSVSLIFAKVLASPAFRPNTCKFN